MRKSKLFLSLILAAYVSVVNAQVDYSVVYVNEEAGVEFTQVTSENDYVCLW